MNLYQLWGVEDRPAPEPDCFIVPSYTLKDRETPALMTRSQIEKAVSWQRRFPKAKVIFSTGDAQGLGVADAAVMSAYARSIGLPEAAILQETKSKNTYENLLFSRRMADEFAFKQSVLVLYDLHARRVLAIAAKMAWKNLYWLSASAPGEGADGIKWFRTFSRPAILVYEILGMVYSRWKAWL